MQERHMAEPVAMSESDSIQKLALKILFASGREKAQAQKVWKKKKFDRKVAKLILDPAEGGPNVFWSKRIAEVITSYKVRPIVIHDDKVAFSLNEHLKDLTRRSDSSDSAALLDEARTIMAKRIFDSYLTHDIIALQEANYLNAGMFPVRYQVLFSSTGHLKNGIAWNTDKLELVESLGDVGGKSLVLLLRHKESTKTVMVAAAHLTGCDPFRMVVNPSTGLPDSAKGDGELQAVVDFFKQHDADVKIIAMDSNVTSLHPRLKILKDASFKVDYENYIDATCSNPYMALNTRLDWIAIKGISGKEKIVNIPVMNVGLNSPQTNMSDHAPIAAKIEF
jgi:hypothetical protein